GPATASGDLRVPHGHCLRRSRTQLRQRPGCFYLGSGRLHSFLLAVFPPNRREGSWESTLPNATLGIAESGGEQLPNPPGFARKREYKRVTPRSAGSASTSPPESGRSAPPRYRSRR